MRKKDAPLHPLRQARLSLARPLTQVQLAELVGIGTSTVERAESGKAIRVDNIQLLCAFFDKDAHELGLLPVYREGIPRQEVCSALSAQPSTSCTPDANSGTQSSESRIDGLRQVRPREIEDFVNRHEFLHSAVRVGGAIFFAPNELMHPELVDRLNIALKKPSTLDAVTLNGLKTTTQSYGHLFAQGSVPSPALLAATAGHFRLVVQFLQGSLLPSTRSALSAVASETAQLAGRLLIETHLYEQAQRHYNLALVTAQEANDVLYATGLARIGTLMSATNRFEEAIVYLEEAQRIATRCSAYTLVCWSAAEQAEVHADVAVQVNAEQPDDQNCLKSLETMNSYVERMQPREETFGTFFNSSRPIAYQGSCYMRLQRPHLARPALLSGLSVPDTTAETTQSILLDLVTTSIQEQEIEQACSYIHQSLALILQAHAMRSL
ncbi:MAG: helix-turn-helix domain-containing protein, partial [Chloroflexi bacterium]|nr:helix-turn-helix domain-containing protein [Chloroflexota bacterium]